MGHALLLVAATLLAALVAHRLAGGPGIPSRAYVLPAQAREDLPRPWWQLGLQLGSTFGRRWLRTRLRRRGAAGADPVAVTGRPDGTLLLPGRRDAEHATAATRAAVLAAATTVGTIGLGEGAAWQVPPVAAVLAALVGLATVRPGVALPVAVGLVLVPVSGAAAAVAAGIAGAVAVAGTVRRRARGWVRVGTALAVLLLAESIWRLGGG